MADLVCVRQMAVMAFERRLRVFSASPIWMRRLHVLQDCCDPV